MASTPLYAGFDLGTTNSAAAVFDGTEVRVVRNSAGGSFTPSVVYVDGRGREFVGERANQQATRDGRRALREFKRLMGTAQKLEFEAAPARLPQELSALVLSTLRRDIADVTGVLPVRAVVSVPALFELPQNKATAEAAQLAGFEQVELLQEPIASALAAGWKNDEPGAWMVYDLGGGTFDVSLLETRDGLLRVVGHDGDNFLGGRDFDRAVVDWMIAELAAQGKTPPQRGNPAHADALATLRRIAEAGKVELSRAEQSELYLDGTISVDGKALDGELTLDREALERICAPLVQRTLAVCERLLATHGLTPDQLRRVVLVGGPSIMPLVRRQVSEVLRAEIATGHDPMTLVAQGAALYAATAGLESESPAAAVAAAGAAAPSADMRRVWCQYPPVSSDLEPHVIGRFEPHAAGVPTSVCLARLGPDGQSEWTSPSAAVDAERSFVAHVMLASHRPNQFRIIARDQSGVEVPVEPSTLRIIHGITISDPPLSRSTGVALADNTVHVYFERGTALPARRTFTHYTIATVTAGSSDSVVSIPIVQGEFDRADLCQLVGTLEISGRTVRETIPSGTAVEMTVLLDRGGRLEATARIPLATGEALQFDGVAQLVMPEPTVESLRENCRAVQGRAETLSAAAFREGDSALIGRLQHVHAQLDATRTLIDALAGGDADAGHRAARQVLDADAALSQIDHERNWPEFEDDANESYSWAMFYTGSYGNESEQRLLARAGAALERALERRSVADVSRQVRTILHIGSTSYRRDPESAQHEFEYWVGRLEESTDLGSAKQLEREGRQALRDGDHTRLRSVVSRLRSLFPPDPKSRRMGYNSGVR